MLLWPPCLFSATGGFFVANLQRSNCEEKKYNQPFSFLISQLTAPQPFLSELKHGKSSSGISGLAAEKIIQYFFAKGVKNLCWKDVILAATCTLYLD